MADKQSHAESEDQNRERPQDPQERHQQRPFQDGLDRTAGLAGRITSSIATGQLIEGRDNGLGFELDRNGQDCPLILDYSELSCRVSRQVFG